ncbi:MAG: hypothetical protein M3O50_10590 [Myxococcota bacterium]|nr:hypothetical protein [Myxococcota bacterium]
MASMKPDQHVEVMRLAVDAGVPAAFFAGWVEGEELAIHRRPQEPASGPGRQDSDAQAGWVLDLGARSHPLTAGQAEALTRKLNGAGIAFAAFPLSHDYLQRKGEE